MFSLSRSSGVIRDFSHSVISVVAVRFRLLGENPFTILGNISLSFVGESGISISLKDLDLLLACQQQSFINAIVQHRKGI
jgi:hypothetical protein